MFVRVANIGEECKASDLELDVAANAIKLSFKQSDRKAVITVTTTAALNSHSSKASFSTKKRTITAQIGLL